MALRGNTELAAIGNEYIKRIATSSTATKIRPEPVSADERQNAQKSGHNEKRPTVSKMFFGSALPPPKRDQICGGLWVASSKKSGFARQRFEGLSKAEI